MTKKQISYYFLENKVNNQVRFTNLLVVTPKCDVIYIRKFLFLLFFRIYLLRTKKYISYYFLGNKVNNKARSANLLVATPKYNIMT